RRPESSPRSQHNAFRRQCAHQAVLRWRPRIADARRQRPAGAVGFAHFPPSGWLERLSRQMPLVIDWQLADIEAA
ncbi:MAG: hypothetical protein KY475_27040, partial [Planctomycetes bacterium]|nr:hypothetical protein [Planctomycetota bacterium]